MDEQHVSRRSLWVFRTVVFFSVLGPMVVAFVILVNVTQGSINTQSPGQVAMSYARRTLQWNQGPYLKGTYPTTMGSLESTMKRHQVPKHVMQDVNVQRLLQQYAPTLKVDLVVLTGVFDTLPPDEGITGPGTMVALVDPRQHRVLYVMD